MAAGYGFDVSVPATTAKEAVQWLYLAYLAAVKEGNGAAMSLGRTSTFLDIYFQRDLANAAVTEEQVQEMIDDFVIKLRIIRFLRTPEYDELFAGDPTWVTESIGGSGDDGRPLVTRTSFRYLQTLYNLGPAPEPNLTIWYSARLPDAFRSFAAKVAIDTSSIACFMQSTAGEMKCPANRSDQKLIRSKVSTSSTTTCSKNLTT